jgi:hypothetical protein
LIVLIAVLVGGEVFVRAFINGPSPQVYDPEIGYAYLPHAELFQAKEGSARFRFNALGLNDEELGPKNGRCRVLVVGDSYTTALQVPREVNFTSVAEKLDPRLDVVNGGRDGLFLGDAHKMVHRLANEVDPDLVVYVVSEGDVEDDIALPDFKVLVDPATGAIVDAVMQVEGKEWFKEVFGPVLHKSALATRLSGQLQPSAANAAQLFAWWRGWFSPAVAAPPSNPVSEAKPSPEEVLAFVFRRLAFGHPTALLYVEGLHYQPGGNATVAPSSSRAEAETARAAKLAGVPMFDTAQYLIDATQASRQPPFGFDNNIRPGGHLNAVGHRAVAQALVDLVGTLRPSLGPECAEQ